MVVIETGSGQIGGSVEDCREITTTLGYPHFPMCIGVIIRPKRTPNHYIVPCQESERIVSFVTSGPREVLGLIVADQQSN